LIQAVRGSPYALWLENSYLFKSLKRLIHFTTLIWNEINIIMKVKTVW